MKNIKEIEKGRLDEESMIRITGGEGNDPCTPYVNCTGQHIVKPCANNYHSCDEVTVCGSKVYRDCTKFKWIFT